MQYSLPDQWMSAVFITDLYKETVLGNLLEATEISQ